MKETDGICSMRGLNHVIDNEGDKWYLFSESAEPCAVVALSYVNPVPNDEGD